MKAHKYIIVLFAMVTAFASCRKDDEIPVAVLSVVTDSINPSYTSVYIGCHVECNVPYKDVRVEISENEDFNESQRVTMASDVNSKGIYTVSSEQETKLKYNTRYFYRYIVENGMNSLATKKDSFHTQDISLPEIVLNSVENITENSASLCANLKSTGGDIVHSCGFCYSTAAQPNIVYNDTIEVTPDQYNVLRTELKGLQNGTRYYIRAFAVNSKGAAYSDVLDFRTTSIAEVITEKISDITLTSATIYGNVIDDGGASVTARGICYSTSQNPTTSNSNVTSGSGTGSFRCTLSGLSAGTTYYVRAYATNSNGTAYSGQRAFTTATTVSVPTVTTGTVSSITTSSASVSGNVTSDGGARVNARGICYSTSQNPTISNTKVTSGSGTGSFSCSLTGLTAGTTYYVRAYATNSEGTAYGEQLSFTTLSSSSGDVPVGAISGLFSVSSTKQVYFSQGNLQYQASTKTWRFAENQWDYVGISLEGTVYQDGVKCDNLEISSTYTGWIDYFGWGTGSNPTLTSTDYADYSTFTDWGVNRISNGGNTANMWRTLTKDEWRYLFNRNRNLWSLATVNNVMGCIVLPDNWLIPGGVSFTALGANDDRINTYSATDWAKMEQNGAVFLPAAGYRINKTTYNGSSCGHYWGSSQISSYEACFLEFSLGNFGVYSTTRTEYGRSVRLVHDVE